MTSIHASHDRAYSRRDGAGFFKLYAWVVEIAAMLAAAIRVSRAVEARRRADDADLRTLGIKGKLPEMW